MPVTTETKPNVSLGNFSSYKEKYSSMKVKLKDLLYENELFQDELRKLQRELLDIYRDKETLLERVMQIEDIDLSNSDSESQTSDKVISANQAKQKPSVTNNEQVIASNGSQATSYIQSQATHHVVNQTEQPMQQQHPQATMSLNTVHLIQQQQPQTMMTAQGNFSFSQNCTITNSNPINTNKASVSGGAADSGNNLAKTTQNQAILNNASTSNASAKPKSKPAASRSRSKPAAKATKNNGGATKSAANGSGRSTAAKKQKQQQQQQLQPQQILNLEQKQLPMTLVGQIHVPTNGEQYKFIHHQANLVDQNLTSERMNNPTGTPGYIQDQSHQTHHVVHEINLPTQQQQAQTTLHHMQQPPTIMTTQGNFNFSQSTYNTTELANNNNELSSAGDNINTSTSITKTSAPNAGPKPKTKPAASRSRSKPAAKTTKNNGNATKPATNGSRSTAAKNNQKQQQQLQIQQQQQQQQQMQQQQQQQQQQIMSGVELQQQQLPMTLVGQIVPVSSEQYKYMTQQPNPVDQNSVKSIELNEQQVNITAGGQPQAHYQIQDQPMQTQTQQAHHVVHQINLPMQQQQPPTTTTIGLESFQHIQQPQTIMTTQGNFNFSQGYTIVESTNSGNNNGQYQTYSMIGSNASNHSESILSTPPPIQIIDANHHHQQQQLSHHNSHGGQQQHQHNDEPMSPEELMEQHLESRRMEQAALLMPEWDSSGPSEIFGSDSAIKFMAED